MKKTYQSPYTEVVQMTTEIFLSVSGPTVKQGTGEVDGAEAMTEKKENFWGESHFDAE